MFSLLECQRQKTRAIEIVETSAGNRRHNTFPSTALHAGPPKLGNPSKRMHRFAFECSRRSPVS